MNKILTLANPGGRFQASAAWQPLFAIAQAVLWPSRWLAMAWILTIGLLLVGILSSAGLPLISGIVLLISLHLVIPIEINNLTRKKSWLLLPDFQALVLKLLLFILLIWLAVITLLNFKSSTPNWLLLPYSALVFSLVMLPTIYVRHLWPLLAEIILLLAITANTSAKNWLLTTATAPWFIGLVIICTIAMWLWMKYRWLRPAQCADNTVNRISLFAICGVEVQWLLRLTRGSTSLEGTLLLGDGDRWHASVMRALYATWVAPVAYWATHFLFGSTENLPEISLEKPAFLALLTLGPLLTLGFFQLKSSQRLARCWLFLGGDRQSMYGFVERKFYQDLLAYQAMTVVLMFSLLPVPMILPMLCYGSCATILLCYLVFALSGRSFWWSISANVLLLIALMVAMKYLWTEPDLIYLSSLALILPVYSLRRYGKARWLRLDYSQLKPKQLL